ncbi:MAG: hypothetical protein IRZ33_06085 [Alicyclobacillaceae bacterium]|nr:hypothetical protein [Alicyclobacillaceae bacterium]
MRLLRQLVCGVITWVTRATAVFAATVLPIVYPALAAPSIPWWSAIDYVWEQSRGLRTAPTAHLQLDTRARERRAGHGASAVHRRSGRPLTA